MSFDFMERVWWRDDLPTMEKFVALAIADHADDEDGAAWPAVETLARKCSCSTRTVQNAIKGLMGKGLLRKVERRDRTNIYILVIENLPRVERPRRMKEKSPLADVFGTGAGDSPDLFGTGESGSATGESGSATGAGDSPRTIIRTDNEPSTLSGNNSLPAVQISGDQIINDVAVRWNELAGRHPGIQKARLPLDDARRNAIRLRSSRTETGQTVEQLWNQFFANIEASPFLQGRVAPSRGRSKSFTLTMTWALNSANFNEIMEGKYGTGSNNQRTHSANGRELGPAEQATHSAIAGLRAAREQRR